MTGSSHLLYKLCSSKDTRVSVLNRLRHASSSFGGGSKEAFFPRVCAQKESIMNFTCGRFFLLLLFALHVEPHADFHPRALQAGKLRDSGGGASRCQLLVTCVAVLLFGVMIRCGGLEARI